MKIFLLLCNVFCLFASDQDQNGDSPFWVNDGNIFYDMTLDMVLFPDDETDSEIQNEFSGGISSQDGSKSSETIATTTTATTITTTATTTTTTTAATTTATTTVDSSDLISRSNFDTSNVNETGTSIYGAPTGRSTKIENENINKALVPTHVDSSDLISRSNFDTSNVNETGTSIYWVIFGAGGILVVIVVLIIYFVNKNKEPHVKKHTANISNHIILKKGKDLASKMNLVAENEDKIKEDFMKAEENTEGSQKHHTHTHNAKLVRNEEHNWSDVVPYDSNMVTIRKKLGIKVNIHTVWYRQLQFGF